MKGKGGKRDPAHDKLWDGIAGLQGQGASRGLQPVILRCVGDTAAHLKSYDNEPGTTEAIGEGNSVAQRKYFKGIKELSSKKTTRLPE